MNNLKSFILRTILIVTLLGSMLGEVNIQPAAAMDIMAGASLQTADGALDSTFGTGGIVTTDFSNGQDFGSYVAIQPDGKILASGEATVNGNMDFALARYNPDGSLDATFGGDGKVTTDFARGNDEGYSVALQGDGKILQAGSAFNPASYTEEFALVRYNSDGSLDTTFDSDGKVITPIGQTSRGYSVVVQADGKIVQAGDTSTNGISDFALARYNSNGSLDASFGVNGVVTTDFGNSDSGYAMALQPWDGKIIVAGGSYTADNVYIILARYNGDGSLDNTFDLDGKVITTVGSNDHILDLALQPDGRILAAGEGDQIGTGRDFVLVRYNSDGSLDTTFDSDGKVTTDFNGDDDGSAVAVQPDGRIIVAGAGNDRSTIALARYLSNGSLDPGFGVNGKVVSNPGYVVAGHDMVLQPDQNIIVTGIGSTGPAILDFAVARYINHSGSRIYYVKSDAPGANNGTSWEDAYTDLQSALSAASSGDQIWVAQGTYRPTESTDRTASFTLKNGVGVYGGFAGNESVRTQRDPAVHVTVLSGDLGIMGNNADNSYHVVTASNTDGTAVLDGFTITAGNANDINGLMGSKGGGMYIDNGSPTLQSLTFTANSATFGGGLYNVNSSYPTLTDVKFNSNSATEGGGMRNESNSYPSLSNVIFNSNTAIRFGGGMENLYSSRPTLRDVTFSGNSAPAGGGMFNWIGNYPTLINVTFNGNSAVTGGGIGNYYSSPNLTNVTFYGNSATSSGGGMYNENNSYPFLTNVTLSSNTAAQGGGIYNDAYGSNPIIMNSILYGNTGGQIYNVSGTANVQYSIVQDGYPGTGNITADPLLTPLQNNGGLTQTVRLAAGSPAIDAGSDSNCPSTDQRGVTRPQGAHCDIGAYEYGIRTMYVKWDATGTNDGSSWANAFTDLQSALAVSFWGDQIWVAQGTYKPGTARTSSFVLKSGVDLYGGFTGVEKTPGLRDPSAHVTVLSGDVNGNDNDNISPDEPTRADNVYHVVSSAGAGLTAVLDGFTITGGNANLNPGEHTARGGGIWNAGDPYFKNLVVRDNSALELGGGIYNENSYPSLRNITLENNTSAESGGGLANYQAVPTLTIVTIKNNRAAYSGGGVMNANGSNARFYDLTLSGNSSSSFGGGMSNYDSSPRIFRSTLDHNSVDQNDLAAQGGGLYNSSSNPILDSVTFVGNTASSGGSGVANLSSNPTFNYVTFTGNWDAIRNTSSHPVVRHSIIWGNVFPGTSNAYTISDDAASQTTVTDSVIQNGFPGGTHVITTDPLLGILGNYGGLTQTVPLSVGSSAIDAANDPNCSGTDQRGMTRPQGSQCDVGSFELRNYTVSGNVGISGAALSYADVPYGPASNFHLITADSSGNYTLTRPEGWTGSIVPSLSGYTFSPVRRTYSRLAGNQPAQDFSAAVVDAHLPPNPGATTRLVPANAPQDPNVINFESIRISGNGRYVAFVSNAIDLVAGDTNMMQDVFVRDRLTGTITRASVDSGGVEARDHSFYPSISQDGRYVAFESWASNLDSACWGRNVFVHDLQTHSTTCVSVNANGEGGNSDSDRPQISADGRYVVYRSFASNLISGDTNNQWDVFVFDLLTRTTVRASVSSTGVQGNSWSQFASISADGRYVAFESNASNLVNGDVNGKEDVFVRDLWNNTTSLVSVDSSGVQGNNVSFSPSISYNGQYVAFASSATNLVSGDTNGASDVFVRDLQTMTTRRVSLSSNNTQGNDASTFPVISGNGRFVVFESDASNLVANDTGVWRDVFVRDLLADKTTRVSVSSAGVQGDNASALASISWEGRYVTFESRTTNLVSPLTPERYVDALIHENAFTLSGNAGIAGAVIAYEDGGLKTATADADGNYSLTVSYRWWGTLTPSKAGYVFTPASRSYADVLEDLTGVNFNAISLATDTPTATPTFTFTPTPTNTPTSTPTSTPTNTPTPTNTFTPTATPPYSYNPLYLSLTGNQTLGGISSADEDILKFDGKSWSLFFDGSDVGVGGSDLFAFSMLDADSLLLSFTSSVTVNGVTAAPQDVLRFDATSLGANTAGTFSMYFDGSDVGIDASSESIDALALLPDGRLLLSTTGNASVTGVSGVDEDILAFTPSSLGSVTAGTWAMYFDGSDVGLSDSSNEDIDAADVGPNGNIYLSTLGDFSVSGVSGADEDVFICVPTSIGSMTACSYSSVLYFDGSTWGLSGNDVDAFNYLALGPLPPTSTPTNTPTQTPTSLATSTPTATSIITSTPTSTSTPTHTPTITVTPGSTFTPTPTFTSTPTSAVTDVIFKDGFESSNLSAWTSSSSNKSSLSVSQNSALAGSYGLQVQVSGTTAIYVNDASPAAEPHYRARFYFDPNSITMASGDYMYILQGYTGSGTGTVRVEFKYSSGVYQVRARIFNNSAAMTSTPYVTISDGPHALEFDWVAASAAGANDGSLTFWVDGVQQGSLTGIANDTHRMESVRLGVPYAAVTGTSGTLYFDAFESRRQTYIGP